MGCLGAQFGSRELHALLAKKLVPLLWELDPLTAAKGVWGLGSLADGLEQEVAGGIAQYMGAQGHRHPPTFPTLLWALAR